MKSHFPTLLTKIQIPDNSHSLACECGINTAIRLAKKTPNHPMIRMEGLKHLMETEKDQGLPGNSSVTEDTPGNTDCVGSSPRPCLHLKCSSSTSEKQQAATAVKSEGGSCQDPLLPYSWTFSHVFCPSRPLKQLSTKYQQDIGCKCSE